MPPEISIPSPDDVATASPSTIERSASATSASTTNHLMAGLMALIGTVNILFAERLTINAGLGWDGLTYAAMARNLYERIFIIRMPEYNLQRILPSAIVHYALRLFRVEPTDIHIIYAFDIYNLVLLIVSVYAWGGIADRLHISVKGKWLGFVLLFLNYAILKNNFYHPTLTDTTAFTLGLLMFYFFLADRFLGLIAVLVAGFLTWPTVAPFAAVLCAFPRVAEKLRPAPSRAPFRLNIVFAAFMAVGATLGLLLIIGPKMWIMKENFGRALRLDMPVIYLSIAATALFVFLALRVAADDGALFNVREIWAQLNVRRAGVAAVIFLILKIVTKKLANGEPAWANLKLFTAYSLATSVTEPFHFIVSHVVYYGPAILLMAVLWRPLCDAFGRLGIGMRILLVGNVLMAVNPQSRYHLNIVTVFIALLVLVLDRLDLDTWRIAALAVLCVAWSKVWYVMNRGPVSDDGTMDVLLRFPLQHYFMNSGPWMSHPMYLAHAAAVLVTAALLYVLFGGPFISQWRALRTADAQ